MSKIAAKAWVVLTGLLLQTLLVAVVGAAPAGASHRQISGEFVATGHPFPHSPVWWWNDGPCPLSQEGIHKVSHSLTAPFRGWLSVTMDFPSAGSTPFCWITGLCGWALYLTDADGNYLGYSWYQQVYWEPHEELDYFLEKGEEVFIVACNQSATADARVEYALTHERPWTVPAGKGRWERVEELDYIAPAPATTSFLVTCGAGCVEATPHPRARSVSIEIEDVVSPDVAAILFQYQRTTETLDQFCTATDEPVRLQPRVDWVMVALLTGPCEDGTPATATQGKVTMTFTNR